jgi:hypothetical protein
MPHYPTDWASTMQPALYAFVAGSLGASWRVIWGGQQGPGQTSEGPRPVKPYAVLRALTTPAAEAQSAVLPVTASPTVMNLRATVPALFTFEVQLFADTDRRDALANLGMDLGMPDARAALRVAGLAVR